LKNERDFSVKVAFQTTVCRTGIKRTFFRQFEVHGLLMMKSRGTKEIQADIKLSQGLRRLHQPTRFIWPFARQPVNPLFQPLAAIACT
jgi:hypothetical protein